MQQAISTPGLFTISPPLHLCTQHKPLPGHHHDDDDDDNEWDDDDESDDDDKEWDDDDESDDLDDDDWGWHWNEREGEKMKMIIFMIMIVSKRGVAGYNIIESIFTLWVHCAIMILPVLAMMKNTKSIPS